jgi:anti-anti-sigma factor
MNVPTPFEVISLETPEGVTLTAVGELDIASVSELETSVEDALARGTRRLVIDLSRLTFIDSSGLRSCIILYDRAVSEGWSLGLVRPSAPALTVFEMTGADENLPFIDAAAKEP